MKQGFFNVDVLNEIDAAEDLATAKKIAMDAVEAQPNAREGNKKKATDVINQAHSKKMLLISLGNFMLAHPSENLGMNRE